MAALSTLLHLPLLITLTTLAITTTMAALQGGTSWCVARSDASDQELQTALDYACWAGADCTPIKPNGLCYLPNTMQAHASYAFNNFYQRKGMAPGSCDFSGTATIAKTDPSYGSCVYPSSAGSAGGITANPSITINDNSWHSKSTHNADPAINSGGVIGVNPGVMGPPLPNLDDSIASESIVNVILLTIALLIVYTFT